MEPVLAESQVKELFKQAVVEVLQERKDLLYDAFAEALEDIALAEAIREGMTTETVTRAEVLQLLEEVI